VVDGRFIISSVRVLRLPRYGGNACIRVWNRGGLAGFLMVEEKDAEAVARRLFGAMPHHMIEERELDGGGTEQEWRPRVASDPARMRS